MSAKYDTKFVNFMEALGYSTFMNSMCFGRTAIGNALVNEIAKIQTKYRKEPSTREIKHHVVNNSGYQSLEVDDGNIREERTNSEGPEDMLDPAEQPSNHKYIENIGYADQNGCAAESDMGDDHRRPSQHETRESKELANSLADTGSMILEASRYSTGTSQGETFDSSKSFHGDSQRDDDEEGTSTENEREDRGTNHTSFISLSGSDEQEDGNGQVGVQIQSTEEVLYELLARTRALEPGTIPHLGGSKTLQAVYFATSPRSDFSP
ncbi:hypothetical protein JCM33374_g6633 [Metschnikowia sp. JCM 33374]|nr:hypothetical protein JCM33374_g6633 [Metschnikowia sp. JCM 33374]